MLRVEAREIGMLNVAHKLNARSSRHVNRIVCWLMFLS
jgi:hypothetical protein